MSSSELHTLQRAFASAGGKNTFTLGRADYQRQYQPILYGWKYGSDYYWCGARDQGDVWFVDKPIRNDLHPTLKPVALVERTIRNSSKSRDVVLDHRWGGLDPDRVREDGAPGAATGARPAILRRDHPALAGVQQWRRDAGWRRPDLQ
jgi:DNA methylase